jgi:hypothetical protein
VKGLRRQEGVPSLSACVQKSKVDVKGQKSSFLTFIELLGHHSRSQLGEVPNTYNAITVALPLAALYVGM